MDTKTLSKRRATARKLHLGPRDESLLRDSVRATVRSFFVLPEPPSSEAMLRSFPAFVKWVAEIESRGHWDAEEAVSMVKNFAGIIMETRLTERLSRQVAEPEQGRPSFGMYYEGFMEGFRGLFDASPERRLSGKAE